MIFLSELSGMQNFQPRTPHQYGLKSRIFIKADDLCSSGRIESPHHLKNNPTKTARFKRLYATKKAKGFRLLGDLPTGVIPI
jgi:hypothetical protein